MKLRNLTAALLAILTLSQISCGSSDSTDADTTAQNPDITAVPTETEDPLPDNLPEKDYGGATFVILSRDDVDHKLEAFAEAENGEPVNDAVFQRNRAVSERFNIKFDFVWATEADEYTLTDKVEEAVTAGSEDYHIAIPQTTYGGFCAPDGYFYNWHDVPYINLSQPWWNADSAERLTIDGKLHLLIGDYLTTQLDYTWGMIFNKQMVSDYDLESPYELVRSGKWTLDTFCEYIKGVSGDIDGDGKMTEADRWGFVTHSDSAIGTWTYAMDLSVAEYDETGYPIITINNDKTIDVVERLYTLIYESDTTLYNHWGVFEQDPKITTLFEQGNALIAAAKFNSITKLRNMDADFGIIPYPKYDEAQEKYYTQVDLHAGVLAIPSNVTDPERTGIIMEALCAESHKNVVPAFYDLTLKTKGARDDESADMLDLILDGRYTTLVSAYEGWEGVQWFTINCLKNSSKNFVSHYERNIKKSELRYQKIFEAYQAMDE